MNHETHTHTHTQLRNAALKKIRTQFPNIPEAQLCFAIIENAVFDLTAKKYRNMSENRKREMEEHKRSAEEYLTQDSIFHAELCGVETSWIQRILRECGILK